MPAANKQQTMTAQLCIHCNRLCHRRHHRIRWVSWRSITDRNDWFRTSKLFSNDKYNGTFLCAFLFAISLLLSFFIHFFFFLLSVFVPHTRWAHIPIAMGNGRRLQRMLRYEKFHWVVVRCPPVLAWCQSRRIFIDRLHRPYTAATAVMRLAINKQWHRNPMAIQRIQN